MSNQQAELLDERRKLAAELVEVGDKIGTAKPKDIAGLLERQGVVTQTIEIIDARLAAAELAQVEARIASFNAEYEAARIECNEANALRQELQPKWAELNAKIIDRSEDLKRAGEDIEAVIASAVDLYRRMLTAIVESNHYYRAMVIAQGALPGLRERRAELMRNLKP